MNRYLSMAPELSVLAGCALVLACAAIMTGCDRQTSPTDHHPGSNGDNRTTTQPVEPFGDVATAVPKDGEDDPDAPRALPRSAEIQGWIKTKAIQVAPADQLAEYVEDPAVRRVLGEYQFTRLARVTYESPNATAQLLMAEAKTVDDAVGAFSVLSDAAPCSPREDGSLRASQPGDGTQVLTACQGNVFLRLDCKLEEEAGHRDCEALLSRTVFGLPTTEQPLLMRAVKDVQKEGCQFWIVRSAQLLKQQANLRLRQIEPASLETYLGLDGSVLLSATAVEQTRGAAPIIIWLAQYPTAAGAKAAAERYAQAIASEPQGIDAVTFIGSAKGIYLMGTWTADQHAARELVTLLEEVLPAQE